MPVRQRRRAPRLGSAREMMQERERQGEAIRIGAVEAGAADHHVEAVLQHVAPDAMPKQLHRAFVAVGRQHAGSAELEEAELGMPSDEVINRELAGGVEPTMSQSDVLAQEPVGADDRGSMAEPLGPMRVVDHKQMVADPIEGIDVAACEEDLRVGDGRALLIEYPVTKLLRP